MQVKAARAGPARGRGAGRLPPAHRPEQGQRHRARHDRRRHEDPRDDPAPRACRQAGARARSGRRWCSPPACWRGPGALRRRPGIALAPRALRRWPSLAYLVALAASRGLSRRGLLACLAAAVVWRARARRRAAAPEQRHQPLRLGRARPGPRREPLPLERPARVAALGCRCATTSTTGLNHKDYTAVYPPLFLLATRAVVARPRLLHGDEGLPRAVRARDPRRCSRAAPAAPRPAARAAPGPRLEPARARRDRGQRPQRGLRHAVAGRWRSSPWMLDRPLLSALAAGAGFLAKYLPGLVAAAWARRYRPWHVRRGGARRGARRPALPRRGLAQDDAAEPLEVLASSGASTRRCSRRSPRSSAATRPRSAPARS